MNKFLILTWGLGGAGGGQQYVANRCSYYNSLGWESYVVHQFDGEIIMPGLKDLRHLYKDSIGVPCGYFSNDQKQTIISDILKFIGFNSAIDEVLIESNSIQQATWSEELAKQTCGKHFHYVLNETGKIFDKYLFGFLKFKLERGEVAGIAEKSIPYLFSKYEEIGDGGRYCIAAPARTDVLDYSCPALERLDSADYVIGVLGRLEKPFVLPTLNSITVFAKNHSTSTFIVILVGDTDNVIIKHTIDSTFTHITNCKLVKTGFLCPIPKRIVDVCDICISSSGCAGITDRAGRLTISIDGEDCDPIGFLGYTTDNTLFRQNEPRVPLETLLEEALIGKRYPLIHAPKANDHIVEDDLRKEDDYIRKSSACKQYYDMKVVYPYPYFVYRSIASLKTVIKRIIHK